MRKKNEIFIEKNLGREVSIVFLEHLTKIIFINPKTRFERKTPAIVSLPEQFSPNRPSKHWQCPSFPQDPWPLHVVLGLQNAKTNEKKVNKSTSKSENNENLIAYLYNQMRSTHCHSHKYHPVCRFHDHCNWLQVHMQL